MSSQQRPVIEDVLEILTSFAAVPRSSNIPEQRMRAIQRCVEQSAGRFKTENSASRSLRDACTRRLGGIHTHEFDSLLERWTKGQPAPLRSAIMELPTSG